MPKQKPFPVKNLNEYSLKELKRLYGYLRKEANEWVAVLNAVVEELNKRGQTTVKRKKK